LCSDHKATAGTIIGDAMRQFIIVLLALFVLSLVPIDVDAAGCKWSGTVAQGDTVRLSGNCVPTVSPSVALPATCEGNASYTYPGTKTLCMIYLPQAYSYPAGSYATIEITNMSQNGTPNTYFLTGCGNQYDGSQIITQPGATYQQPITPCTGGQVMTFQVTQQAAGTTTFHYKAYLQGYTNNTTPYASGTGSPAYGDISLLGDSGTLLNWTHFNDNWTYNASDIITCAASGDFSSPTPDPEGGTWSLTTGGTSWFINNGCTGTQTTTYVQGHAEFTNNLYTNYRNQYDGRMQIYNNGHWDCYMSASFAVWNPVWAVEFHCGNGFSVKH
jgi:hypothetical protein